MRRPSEIFTKTSNSEPNRRPEIVSLSHIPSAEGGLLSVNLPIEEVAHERRLELLVDAVVDYALYLLNPRGEIVSWNPGARRLKGYEAEEVIGSRFHNFSTPEGQAEGLPDHALEIATRSGHSQRRIEILGIGRD